jgi:hypothetical protein
MAPGVNQGIGRAKVDRQVIGKITQDILEHAGEAQRKINGVI